jgi:hypothetical protein
MPQKQISQSTDLLQIPTVSKRYLSSPRYPNRQSGPPKPLTQLASGTVLGGRSGWGVMLSAHLHLLSRLIRGGGIRPFLLHAFMESMKSWKLRWQRGQGQIHKHRLINTYDNMTHRILHDSISCLLPGHSALLSKAITFIHKVPISAK